MRAPAHVYMYVQMQCSLAVLNMMNPNESLQTQQNDMPQMYHYADLNSYLDLLLWESSTVVFVF